MEAKFKVNDQFRLKENHTFTRSFPMGGYNKDGTVGEGDKEHRRAGSTGKASAIYEAPGRKAEASYDVDFGDFKVHLAETKLLELFDPV
jgi:hypothetical protein